MVTNAATRYPLPRKELSRRMLQPTLAPKATSGTRQTQTVLAGHPTTPRPAASRRQRVVSEIKLHLKVSDTLEAAIYHISFLDPFHR